jgi:hypothetical protein
MNSKKILSDCEFRYQVPAHKMIRVQQLINDGLCTDGGHHKQWYLEEIAKELGLTTLGLDVREGGIAP